MAEQIETDPVPGEDARHAEFLADADLVIHDAQYTAEEYPNRTGWGHSTVEYVADTAIAAGVGQLALFHHDSFRDDDGVDQLVMLADDRLSAARASLKVYAAAEGRCVELKGQSQRHSTRVDGAERALHESVDAGGSQSVVLVVSDAETMAVLTEAAHAEKLDLRTATAGDPQRLVDEAYPSLVIVDRDHAALDPLALCRVIQEHNAKHGRDAAVVIVSTREDIEAQARECEAGARDWLLAPLNVMYARARMRARHFNPTELGLLIDLGKLVERELEARRSDE